MNDLKSIFDLVAAIGTPFTVAVAWFVWRIYNNHLPHIDAKLEAIDEKMQEDRHEFNRRIGVLEGHQEIRLRRENGRRAKGQTN